MSLRGLLLGPSRFHMGPSGLLKRPCGDLLGPIGLLLIGPS